MSSGRSRVLFASLKNSRQTLASRSCECSNGGGSFVTKASRRALSSAPSTSKSRSSNLTSISTLAPRRVALASASHSRLPFSTYSSARATEGQPASSWAAEKLAQDGQDTVLTDQHNDTASATNEENADWAISYLRQTFPSLPAEFPPNVARRMLTHMSYRSGAQTYGHNARLSFLGRRVLKAYLLMYLQSAVPEEVLLGPGAGRTSAVLGAPRENGAVDGFMDFDAIVEDAVDTRALGERVAPAWALEEGSRWTSAIPPATRPSSHAMDQSYRKGRDKVMGANVEAVIGGVFHQFGGVEAYSLFHSHILPHLDLPLALRSDTAELPFRITSDTEPVMNDNVIIGTHTTSTPQRRRAVA